MPPVSSPGSHDRQGSRFTADDRAARVRYRRAMTLMVMTLLLPGSAQLVAGNRKVGRIALRIWLGLVSLVLLTLVLGLLWHGLVFKIALSTWLLGLLRLALMAGAIAWALLFVDAWRLGQPLSLQMSHRRAVVGVNGLLCLTSWGCSANWCSRCPATEPPPALTTAASTCCWPAATPGPGAGDCGPTP
jgi:hypothetical protein